MTSRKEKIETLKRQLILHPSYLNIIEELEKDLHKLEQLKNIEDELGIDLITLFKALKDGIYDGEETEECYVALAYNFNHEKDKKWSLLVFYYGNEAIERDYLENYGKTWALTKEELENDIENIK